MVIIVFTILLKGGTMRGIEYTARERLKAIKLWKEDGHDILWVAHKMRCAERTIWRWWALYDGTLDSLIPKSKVPHTPNPKSHTEEEKEAIVKVFTENPNISYVEALSKLRMEYAYKRTYFGFWRYVVKNGLRPKLIQEQNEYIPQPYDTPQMLGQKWQMDVKYVPLQCYSGNGVNHRMYQYTMIDEATRERFLFAYPCLGGEVTVDFVKRAIVYFGYIPKMIQTDNGGEFTNPSENYKEKMLHIPLMKKHVLDLFLDKIGVHHQLIRAYTPRHNGKVERSHRTDNEFFYKRMHYTDLQDLRNKMRDWNLRYNNKPHSGLFNRYGKRVWQSPLEKRAELLQQLKEQEIPQEQTPRYFTKYDQQLAYAS